MAQQRVSISSHVPVEETLIFESEYEPELALDRDEKERILSHPSSVAVWIYVDGKPAAEVYGLPVRQLMELEGDVPDVADHQEAMYCYSTTVLPEFRGRGLGRFVKQWWIGMVKSLGFKTVVGHASHPAILEMVRESGGEILRQHPNWYGTLRKCWFYRIRL